MNEIERKARELLAAEWSKLSFDAPAEELISGCELPPVITAGVRAIIAALTPPEGYVLVPVETMKSIRDSSLCEHARGFAEGALAARPEALK